MIEGYRDMIDFAAEWRSEVEESNIAALHRLPAPVSTNILRQSTAHRLRGRLLARQRADFFYHPSVQRQGDHLGALLDEALINALLGNADAAPSATPSIPNVIPTANLIYLEEDIEGTSAKSSTRSARPSRRRIIETPTCRSASA